MPEHSCEDCPAFAAAAVSPTAAPYCQRYARTLGSPKLAADVNRAIWIREGSSCPMHGQEMSRSDKARNIEQANVIGSNTSVVMVAISRKNEGRIESKPLSCVECVYHTAAETVQRELGYTAGLCHARGVVIPAGLTVGAANACDMGEVSAAAPVGIDMSSTVDFILSKDFDPSKNLETVKVKRSGVETKEDQFLTIDPRDWPTDLTVTDEHRAAGIMSWRAIPDPEDRCDPMYLPVYDHELMFKAHMVPWRDPRSTYGEHKPHLYVDYQNLLYDIAVMQFGRFQPDGAGEPLQTPILSGPAGIGKTEAFVHGAWLTNLGMVRISFRDDTDTYAMIGKDALKDGETTWKMGRMAASFQMPIWLLLDEVNVVSDSIGQFLRPILDSAGQFVIEEEPDLAPIVRDPRLVLGGAINPAHDAKNIGAKQEADADIQRRRWIKVAYPPAHVERQIIQSHCHDFGYQIPSKTLDAIMAISAELREKQSDLTISWGIRTNIAVACLSKRFSLDKAYRRTITDALAQDEQDLIHEHVNNHAAGLR